VLDLFEHESEIQSLYNESGRIEISKVSEIGRNSMYSAINVKELLSSLDLKKEIVLTMLNQLEKVSNNFFRVDSVLPASIGLRFHKAPLEELA
jgi:hypothetical protein